MESKLVIDFLKEQEKLMKPQPSSVKPASKIIIRPEEELTKSEDDPEEMYNNILEKKPSAKKVLRFLQICIDSIVNDDD
jgi:hypothetical protein